MPVPSASASDAPTRPDAAASGAGEAGARGPGPARGAAWIALATAAACANGFRAPFLFDDPRPGTPLAYGTRPLVWATFALNRALSGEVTWSYHALNGLVHLLCAWLLYGLLRRILVLAAPGWSAGAREGAARLSAILWAVHPLQTEAVTYLSQRAEAMGALFLLATLYASLRAFQAPRPLLWQVLALLALALGFATKEIVAVTPLLVLLLDATFVEQGVLRALARRKGFYLALLGTSLALFAWFVAPLVVSRGTTAGLHLREHGPLEYARSQPAIVLHYLRLCLWPSPLVFDYGWPVARTAGEIVPAALALGSLAAATLVALWRRSWLGFAGAWFFVILLPTSSVVPIKDLAFEHRVYLSLAAVVVVVVVGGRTLCARLAPPTGALSRALPRALPALLVLSLLALTIRRNHEYRSAVSLWRTVVERAPRNARGYSNLATALKAEGDEDQALELLQRAVELDPSYPSAHFKLGNSWLARGENQRAAEAFERALALDDQAETHAGLGLALFRLGRFAEAEPHFARALALDPDDPDPALGLAGTLAQLGRVDEAIEAYRKVLALAPDGAEAHARLATLLLQRGEAAEALEHARRALALPPETAQEHHDLGRCLEALGRTDEALHAYREARRLAPDVPEPCAAIARLLLASPDPAPAARAEALTLAERADTLTRSKRADVLEVLAQARAASGDLAGAASALELALALPGPARNPELAERLRARLEGYRSALGR